MAKARRIVWLNVVTVVSAAILIGAEVFGAAFAGGWAFANLFELGDYGARILAGHLLPVRRRRHGRFIRNAHARRALHRRE